MFEVIGKNKFKVYYGVEFECDLRQLVGTDWRSLEGKFFRLVEAFGISRRCYKLTDGRIAVITEQRSAICCTIELYADLEEWEIAEHNKAMLSWDPEGRGGRNSYGQKIMWVGLWLEKNPGKRAPVRFEEAPELWHYEYSCKLCREGRTLHRETVVEDGESGGADDEVVEEETT